MFAGGCAEYHVMVELKVCIHLSLFIYLCVCVCVYVNKVFSFSVSCSGLKSDADHPYNKFENE